MTTPRRERGLTAEMVDRKAEARGQERLEPAAGRESMTVPARSGSYYQTCARGTIFVGFRQAVVGLWGEAGLRAVGEHLPQDVRFDTIDSVLVSTEWLPEAHVLAWYEALWSGPCEQRRDRFVEIIDRMMDAGFGRIRKAFLQFASPSLIFVKAPGLWRYDHSHGELTVEAETNSARLRLKNHPYVENPLSCLATAEIYCVALGRARDVSASHYRDGDDALVVRLRWL